MTATNTFTLRNSAGTLSATLKNIVPSSVMPQKEKSFTRHKLDSGSFAYDYPSNPIKRRWAFEIDGEDAGDDLLETLDDLFALTENILLDADLDTDIFGSGDGSISGQSVHFEGFAPVYQVGSHFIYRLELQEV